MQFEERGLTAQEAQTRRHTDGYNEIIVQKKSALIKFLKWAMSPISLMLLAAAGLSYLIGHEADANIIIGLFAANFAVSWWHEQKADQAIEKLQAHLRVQVRALRDERWTWLEARDLVPGDFIELSVGSVVPADVKFDEANNVAINESSLTGESLPKSKAAGDDAFSGSFLTTGQGYATVKATGSQTYFGKTLQLAEGTRKRSVMERDILSISKFLSLISIAAVIVLTAVSLAHHVSILSILTLDISLLIAGIPVALPTVMTLIISIGVVALTKKNAVVRRLSSLEDLANVNLLLSDKTGTLTENTISVAKIVSYGGHTDQEVMALAGSVVESDDHNVLDDAVAAKAISLGAPFFERLTYTPADSERKRVTSVLRMPNGETTVSFGASQIVADLCRMETNERSRYEADIAEAAKAGFRVLALATAPGNMRETDMAMVGLLLLSDTVRPEARETLDFMKAHGIIVKMVTGDNVAISERVAYELGLKGTILRREELEKQWDHMDTMFDSVAAFTEILPADKYKLVEVGKKNYIVAVTGDGVNDLPAIKDASVGIAVANAVDALKSAADIVLLSDGIAVIRDAIIEARKIFVRLYNYSVYRISESFRVIITVAVLGFLYKEYPLTPVQLVLLALLNDIPIVTLAFDRVRIPDRPASVNVRGRAILSSTFGLVGVINSLLLFFIALNVFHLPWEQIQTLFFLKLTVSGHMLIYVAHTENRWYKFLPSKEVIIATTLTQLLVTAFALTGTFAARVSFPLVAFIWLWAFFWMQISEGTKYLSRKIPHTGLEPAPGNRI